ncbi:GATA zinc finger domain-containing protein 1 [Oratosquilla oratoria]|uniref:GATA zinc finger domain-containing protein 1 n=1 Tax=Oratosquilla oratoria TaxID=337810 RepID=UPI003F75BA9D
MVFGTRPECIKCKTAQSTIWQKDQNEQVLCTYCFGQDKPKLSSIKSVTAGEKKEDGFEESCKVMDDEPKCEDNGGKDKKDDDDQEGEKDKDSVKSEKTERKETKRRTRKGRQGAKGSIPKGKGRRYIFKKSATKAPLGVATPVTSDYVFYKGTYFQVGDIVSLVDVDGGIFYAQIRGLLQDQYCQKSAVLTWLVPTKNSPPPSEGFSPATYIIGPEEDIPRKLEFMEFVCHAPSDYYKDRTSPYSTRIYKLESCFVWSRLGPQIKPIERAQELLAK